MIRKINSFDFFTKIFPTMPSSRAGQLNGKSVGLEFWKSRVPVPFWPLTGVVPGSPWFNFLATSWDLHYLFHSPWKPLMGSGQFNNLFICEHAIFASTEFSGQGKSTVIHDIKERQTSKNILISPSAAAGGGRGSFNAVIQLHSLCRFSSLFHVTWGTPENLNWCY